MRLPSRTLRNLAVQDFVCFAFHGYMLARALLAGDCADASVARRFTAALFAVTCFAIVVGRSEIVARGRLRAIVYRVCIFTPVVLSYFELRELLAAVAQGHVWDAELEAIDRALFGVPPAVWLQRINRVLPIEWFSFFYYSYFVVISAVLVPSLFFERRAAVLREIMMGAVTVVTVGHVSYTLVPAAGPVAALAFAEPTHGGFFFGLVEHAVRSAGAQMDVFPSLHTALPTFLTLHCFGNRALVPYRWAWPVVGFFAANIVVATMLLRWHWGFDVVCGLGLAAAARAIARAVSKREAGRDDPADERGPVWEPLGRY